MKYYSPLFLVAQEWINIDYLNVATKFTCRYLLVYYYYYIWVYILLKFITKKIRMKKKIYNNNLFVHLSLVSSVRELKLNDDDDDIN